MRAASSGQFIVDTGGDNALFLFAPFVEKHIGFRDSGLATSLQVGSYILKNPATAFSKATKGVEVTRQWDGQIGSQILRRFNLVFDYSHKVLYLEPNERFAEGL